jgi:hypothetical protein
MKAKLLALRENIARHLVDGSLRAHERDDDNGEQGSVVVFVVLSLICICVAYAAPLLWKMGAILWPTVGVLVFHYYLMKDAHEHKTTKWNEFLIAIRMDDTPFMYVFFWPFAIFVRCLWKQTFQQQLESSLFQRKYRAISSSCGHDGAVFAIRGITAQTLREAQKEGDRVKELPQEIVLNTRITATCGATAVVVASAPIRASAEPMPATNTVEVSSYGWATVTAERPTENKGEREDTQDLRHMRLRTIASMKPTHLSVFTELELAHFDRPHQDWFKQYYVSWKPDDTVTLSAGRLAVAPLWMTPPPFLLETVNYQRLPYSFIGYGIDADVRRGKWRLITDITGTTGLKFDDEGQFSRAEVHGRLEYKQNNMMTYAMSGQASRDFVRGSLDFCTHTTWTETKGALYYAENSVAGNTTETVGGYVYAGVRPIPKFKQVELHAQADYQWTRDQTPTAPWILTGGARMLLKEGKYSFTADYQHVPGVASGKDTGTLLLRAQVRF